MADKPTVQNGDVGDNIRDSIGRGVSVVIAIGTALGVTGAFIRRGQAAEVGANSYGR